MSARTVRRRIVSGIMTGLVALLSFLAVLALVLILADLVVTSGPRSSSASPG